MVVATTLERFGRLDIACANAGIAVFKPLLEQTQQDWIDQIDVNGLLGMVNFVFYWYRPGGPMAPEEIAERFFELTLHGVGRR